MSTVSSTPLIEVGDVSKVYRVYRGFGRGWLLSRLLPFADPARFCTLVRALTDASFSIERGEILGIIGRNGSGKTTLLQLVAGLSLPTSGTIEVRGKVRALLSLGVNFHPSFSGRDNILFGSMAMGIRRRDALQRTDEILDFAELHEHADMPLQFYSSGMRSRLAAAVSFQEAPEILIIDEALAAGDAYFVNKCLNRIEDLCNSGSTVLFVSHGVSLVERLCTRALLLEGGRVLEDGEPSSVVNAYRRVLVAHEEAMLRKAGALTQSRATADPAHSAVIDGMSLTGASAVADAEALKLDVGDGVSGTGLIQLIEFYMTGAEGERRVTFDHGEEIRVHIHLRARELLPQVRFYLELYSRDFGVRVAEIGSNYQSARTGRFADFYPENLQGDYELTMTIPSNPLGSGSYYWNLYFAPPSDSMQYNVRALYHCHAYRVCPFMSYSFPGQEWAKTRRCVLEPAVDFDLRPQGRLLKQAAST